MPSRQVATEGPVGSRFTCTTCGRQYSHRSHLRRHETSHLAPATFRCQFCGRLFSRRDVWRKHYTSCTHNANNEAPPPPSRRGKRRRACDQCFRSKLSCDGDLLCGRCKSRKLTCTYTRVQAHGSDVAALASPSPSTLSVPSTATPTSAQDGSTKIPVSFLLSLTNPEAESMFEAFFDEPGRDDDAPPADLQPVGTDTGLMTSDLLAGDAFFFPWGFGPGNLLEGSSFDLQPQAPSHSPPSPAADIDLALAPILMAMKSLHTSLLTTDPVYDGTFDDVLAHQVFTRPNRDVFVPAYFRHTHRDMPLIHRPTFDPEMCAAPLLLLVFICGALYSPPRDCVLAIPGFFRITEEYVFQLLERQMAEYRKCKKQLGAKSGCKSGAAVYTVEEKEDELYQTLQAAALIHGVQFMSNNAAARRRNWMVRRPALVTAVRQLGLTKARHTQVVKVGEGPDWGRFIREETRIKIAATAFLADSQQSGMAQVPFLMAIDEMGGQLPCLQELWEASSASEFEAVITAKGEHCWSRTASLRDCMGALMRDTWPALDQFPLTHVSMLDLQLFMFAFQIMLGAARATCLLETSAPAILRALDRWQELWRATVGQMDSEQLRMSGFVRHTEEFCWLARKLIEYSLSGRDQTSPFFQGSGHESLKELHDLLRELREG